MSNLTTPPRAIFRQIQANLKDRYPSDFTVLKELIQNAEDAKAGTVRFVAHEGWSKASNPLLRVPGLLVSNDGSFAEKDGRGILSFADSAKGEDSSTIGRFGFGQKAVFHLCDAFIVHAFGHAVRFSEVVNPCLGVIEGTKAATWDAIGQEDLASLQAAASGIEQGLLLWVPLRHEDILPAPKLSFVDRLPKMEELISGFLDNRSELHLILAGLRHLNRIELWRGGSQVFGLNRDRSAPRMSGFGMAGEMQTRSFRGAIHEQGAEPSTYVGREASGAQALLDALRSSDRWPQSPVFTDLGEEMLPEKAAVHAAVILTDRASGTETLVDWAVFLPVTNAAKLPTGPARVRLMLHGYFFVDSGRNFIEGFDTSDDLPGSVQSEWNALLRDEVLLPLVPAAIFDAFEAGMLSDEDLATMLSAAGRSRFGQRYRRAIASQHVLARMLEENGGRVSANWRLLPADAALRWVPAANARAKFAFVDILPGILRWAHERGLALATRPAALSRVTLTWQPDEIEGLLAELSPRVFLQGGNAAALAELLDVVVGQNGRLREAAATRLLDLFREALMENASLANEEDLRAILGFLPQGQVIGLPKAAGRSRSVLRSLATARSAPLCLWSELLPQGAERRDLNPAEAVALLQGIKPLLERASDYEAAGAAALCIVKLLGRQLAALLEDARFRHLHILRATNGSGLAKLVSLSDLATASQDRRLFRDSPQSQQLVKLLYEAAPERGALIVRKAEADLLEEIGEPFAFADSSRENFARLILRGEEFGPLEARAKYLHSHFTEAPEALRAMRSMAAGQNCDDGARLCALSDNMGPLATVAEELIAGEHSSLLVAPEILNGLNKRQLQLIDIHEIKGAELGDLLCRNIDKLTSPVLQDETALALLQSDVPDDHLCCLPIFPSRNGRKLVAAKIWKVVQYSTVPAALAEQVPILRRLGHAESDARMERLVRPWTPTGLIDVALRQPQPQTFAKEILRALSHGADPSPKAIQSTKWLADRRGNSWAPEDILDLPQDILNAARQTLAQNSELAFLPLDELSSECCDQDAIETLRRYRILPDGNGSLERLQLLIDEIKPVAVVGDDGQIVADLKALADGGVDFSLPGWPLLAGLLRFSDAPPEGLLRPFGKVRQGDKDSARRFLAALEKQIDSPKLHDAAWSVYREAFKDICQWGEAERHEAFQHIRVPTEAETWEEGGKVARAGSGIALAHLLHRDLREFLPPSDANEVRRLQQDADERQVQAGSSLAASLKPILCFASSEVPPDMLLLFVGLVDRSEPFRAVARECLSVVDQDITRIWSMIDHQVYAQFSPEPGVQTPAGRRSVRRVTFESIQNPPTMIEVETLAGTKARLPIGDLKALGVLGGVQNSLRTIWTGERNVREYRLQIATFTGTRPTSADAKALCLSLAEALIGDRSRQARCFDALDRLADECDRLDQSTVDAARAELEDRLPQVLDELKPRHGSGLWSARKAYRDGIDSIPVGRMQEEARPASKHALWDKVGSSNNAAELLAAIRQRIADYGYDPSRVLFELFQNADDATLQHPAPSEGRFRLTFRDDRMNVSHWGRLINHPGPDVEEGIKKGWRSDLFNMLLMNLSEKREDVTGRFGLGFKSVHLLSSRVSIASHFVSCRIKGGMLPETWAEGREVSVRLGAEGRPATVIDVEIDPERRDDAVRAFTAFRQAVSWLPAMGRAIRCIEIDGHGEWRVEPVCLDAEGIVLMSFHGRGSGYALALDLGDETTIFVPLDLQGPTPAPKELARLWLLAPLAETLCSGWLMNGRRFRVDPGRGRLAGSEPEREAMFTGFGRTLGTRLVALYDLVARDWAALCGSAGFSDRSQDRGPAGFLRALGELFEMDQADPLAKHLHGADRGFGRLIADRPALATGLPLPFSPFLRVGEARFVVMGVLADTRLLTSLNGWQAVEIIGEAAISEDVARNIENLGFGRPRPFRLVDLLRHEVGEAKQVAPDVAHRLGALVNETLMKSADKEEETEILEFLSGLKFLMSNGGWQKAALPPRTARDGDEEEQRILDFAPEKHLAERGYVDNALALYRQAMRQSGFQRGAEALAQWAKSANSDTQKRAVLTYILEGRQDGKLGKLLANDRPDWLPETSDEFRTSPLGKSVSPDDLPRLLGILYPVEQRLLWSGAVQPVLYEEEEVETDPQGFLRSLYDWWQKNHQEERKAYDATTYPPGFHLRLLATQEADEQREGWFTFFALAIFRTLGRTHDGAHRNFITRAQQAGWWQEMARAELPANPGPWLRNLEDFARPEVWKIDYPQWRRALADLYVLARWLPDYVDAYRNLPKVLRQREAISLKDVWRLSASEIWQRRGLEGAPLTQSLGLGANWLIREGMRAELWGDVEKRPLIPYGWAASSRVRNLCRNHIGHDLGEESDMELSRELYDVIESHLGLDADFLGDLDLPMQIVSETPREGVLLMLAGQDRRSDTHREDELMEPDYDEA
ncbi:sacsin N-terminal ATP-binding-like domain-containing protein [Rhizobium ruizarguesonis]